MCIKHRLFPTVHEAVSTHSTAQVSPHPMSSPQVSTQPALATGSSALCPKIPPPTAYYLVHRKCTICSLITAGSAQIQPQCCGTCSFGTVKTMRFFCLWSRCWACDIETIGFHRQRHRGCSECEFLFDGTVKKTRWKWERSLGDHLEVDMDEEEMKRRMRNREEMKSGRYKVPVRCGGCGRMCKGERGVIAHSRWCSGS